MIAPDNRNRRVACALRVALWRMVLIPDTVDKATTHSMTAVRRQGHGSHRLRSLHRDPTRPHLVQARHRHPRQPCRPQEQQRHSVPSPADASGSSSCSPTARISTRWPSPSSKPISGAVRQGHSTLSGRLSETAARSSIKQNAEISSGTLAMRPIKHPAL